MGYLMACETSTGTFRRNLRRKGLGGPLRAILQVPGINLPGPPRNEDSEKVLYILKGIVAQTVKSISRSRSRSRTEKSYQEFPSFFISVCIMW